MIIAEETCPPLQSRNPYSIWFKKWLIDGSKVYASIQFERGIDFKTVDELHKCIGNIKSLVLGYNGRINNPFMIDYELRGDKIYLQKMAEADAEDAEEAERED
jgi:hypothetical protein